MRYYTPTHVWLEPDEDTGRLIVGITKQGNDAMDGIVYVEAVDGKLVVESRKTSLELELPVHGVLQSVSLSPPDNWDRDFAVTVYEPGYELDTSQCMDEDAYSKYASEA